MHAKTPDPSAHPTDASEKALAINLDALRYGSIAEIGAGQEVVRWFFRVGGAAGTVAKSMSAYDMAVSDAIYGKSPRYVSRERLQAMLDHEHRLNLERLTEARGSETAFFSFADTVSAQSYRGNPDCHAWMGIRFQASPGAADSQIILHVRLADQENVQQQEALGIVGVNLMYGAFYHAADPEALLASLLNDLTRRRIEIDMIELSGDAFSDVDNRILSLKLVEMQLTATAMFSADGEVLQASDVLYKQPVLVQRGSFRPPTRVHTDMHQCALAQMSQGDGIAQDSILSIAEMTMSNLTAAALAEGEDLLHGFVEQVDILAPAGLTCVVTRYPEYYRLAEHLVRFTEAPIGMAMGADTLRAVFDEAYYEDLNGGILEAMGRLFKRNVKLYVYPFLDPATDEVLTAGNLEVPAAVRALYGYLLDRGAIQDLQGYDPDLLSIRAPEVLERIRADDDWEQFVPENSVEQIRRTGLFGGDER
jgi:hypothetical protein